MAEEDRGMTRAMLERARALVLCSLLLQSLWGCAAAQDIPPGPWIGAAPMPTARSELAAAALGGRIYVAGGIAQWGTSAAFETYDPATDRWDELPPLPEAVHHLAAAATDGRIYVTGGYTDLLFTEITDRTWAYDPRARTWARMADLPAPRAAHGMAAIESKLYVVGGVGPDSKNLWIYNPAADHWDAARAALPTQREHLTVTALERKLYALGGRWGDSGNLAAVEIYDPAAGRWNRGPDLPTPRSGLTAGVLDGDVHVTGGESLSLGRTFGEHEVFDPATARWTALAGLPTPRHGLASAVVGGRWYVIGGGAKAGALTFISLTDLVEVFPSEPG
jgi:N-acetylneuraminic acid mutarotase